MKTDLGYFYCLTNYLTKAKCFSTYFKLLLALEMDNGAKPVFPNTDKCYKSSWMLSEVKKVLEKDQESS